MLSIIVPAYNEEKLIGATLASIRAATADLTFPHELIVVNDASTDRTPQIAEEYGARVIHVEKRQIAPVRNAGAREAKGEFLLFVDADTLVTPALVREAWDAMQNGAVGGSVRVAMLGKTPFWGLVFLHAFSFIYFGLYQLGAGCFFFARRKPFEASGGFDERYFAGEETMLSMALKKHGKFRVLKGPVHSSGRKLELYTPSEFFRAVWKIARGGHGAVQKRDGLDLWYDGRRT